MFITATDNAPVVCGLDFGGRGGVACLAGGRVVGLRRMPLRVVDGGRSPIELVDGEALAELVAGWAPDAIFGEVVFARRANGALALGRAWGVPMDRLRDPVPRLVEPRRWQRQILGPWLPMVPRLDRSGRALTMSERNKLASIRLVQSQHPEADLMPGRCSSPQDGLADAVCLALYGAMVLREESLVGSGTPGPAPRTMRRGPRGKQRRGA